MSAESYFLFPAGLAILIVGIFVFSPLLSLGGFPSSDIFVSVGVFLASIIPMVAGLFLMYKAIKDR